MRALLLALVGLAASGQSIDATLQRYCVGCHNDKLKTGSISFTGLTAASVKQHPEIFERVFRKMRAGEMPPIGLPRPDEAEMKGILAWLEGDLDRNAAAAPNPGAPAVHRLNRAEYRNAVRDLVGLDMDHSATLPPDDSGYGYDNIADVLTVSPQHVERYVATARKVARLAVGTLKASPATEKFTPARGVARDNLDSLPLTERGALEFRRYFPFDAEYSMLIRVAGNPTASLLPPVLDLRVDGKSVKRFDATVDTTDGKQGSRDFDYRIKLAAGDHIVSAGFLSEVARVESTAGGGGGRGGAAQAPNVNPLSIDYVTVGGPFNATSVGDTPSRKLIFSCRPDAKMTEDACARQNITALAHRAYRRPIVASDIDPLMRLFAEGRKDGGNFDSGMELALAGVMVSPDFLFRVENPPKGVAKGSAYKLGDLEIASRLAFFLWSSIPDADLLASAESGKLRQPAELKRQVARMLADPKSSALTDNFVGQWLRQRNVGDWTPDPDKYKDFDASLRNAMHTETEMFFTNLMREDRSVLELIDSDYTFLNDRLARHYGIQGVKGNYFRRVPLATKDRGGILTQASVLMVTSYTNRTSPVLRGRWILDSVLGLPPPPPPPDVPPLSDKAGSSAKNLRELLAQHRASASCSVCHSKIDPMGFTLENYDAIGRFRTTEDGSPVEAFGSLPNGTRIDGPAGLKRLLLDRKDEFVEAFAAQMTTYALGRGLEATDWPAIRDIRRKMEKDGYRFSAMVEAIATSVPFSMRRVPE